MTKGPLAMPGRGIAFVLLLVGAHLADGRDYMASLTEGAAIELRDADDRVAATVTAGEKFLVVQPTTEVEMVTVFLISGSSGAVALERVREMPDEPLLKLNYAAARQEWKKSRREEHEVAISARQRGVDYYATLLRASDGDAGALKKIFALAPFMDGGGAESYIPQMWELCHLVGDGKFAAALQKQTAEVRTSVGYSFADEWCPLSEPAAYLRRHFPKTRKVLELSKPEER